VFHSSAGFSPKNSIRVSRVEDFQTGLQIWDACSPQCCPLEEIKVFTFGKQRAKHLKILQWIYISFEHQWELEVLSNSPCRKFTLCANIQCKAHTSFKCNWRFQNNDSV